MLSKKDTMRIGGKKKNLLLYLPYAYNHCLKFINFVNSHSALDVWS